MQTIGDGPLSLVDAPREQLKGGPGSADALGHIDELVADDLPFDQRAAERVALAGVGDSFIPAHLRD